MRVNFFSSFSPWCSVPGSFSSFFLATLGSSQQRSNDAHTKLCSLRKHVRKTKHIKESVSSSAKKDELKRAPHARKLEFVWYIIYIEAQNMREIRCFISMEISRLSWHLMLIALIYFNEVRCHRIGVGLDKLCGKRLILTVCVETFWLFLGQSFLQLWWRRNFAARRQWFDFHPSKPELRLPKIPSEQRLISLWNPLNFDPSCYELLNCCFFIFQ